MKALILCGSGNRDGFTWELCKGASEGLESLGIRSEVLDASELRIGHCNGCGACEDGDCPIDDDMGAMFAKFSESDIFILATPIRFSGPSSLIKTVIDRFQPIWHGMDIKRPTYAAGIMCGGNQEARFASTVTIFRAFSITAGMEWMGELTVPGTDCMEPGDVRGKAIDFGKDLAMRIRNDAR